MAESIVQVTEGAGKKLHTRAILVGANTVEDEVVLLGTPSLPTYVTEDAAALNTTTINKHLFQLMAGASLNLYIWRVTLWVGTLAAAATVAPWSLVRLTTAGTGGTVGSPGYPHDSTDAAVGATYMTMPTALGTEGLNLWTDRTVVPAAVPAAGSMKVFEVDYERLRSKPLRIPAGAANGIALKNGVALATATYVARVVYTELNY